jgi:hypothetical protein
MFDIHAHTHRHVTERVHESVTVHEHRAPTDESVRLLRDMERAARDQVVQAIRLENSPIDCVVHAQNNAMSGDREFCVFVRINGQRLEVRRSFNLPTTAEKVAADLLAAVSERIAVDLLAPAFGQLAPHLRSFA